MGESAGRGDGLLTVGHGTLEAEAFLALMRGADVAALVDVRRYPGSRRHPHMRRDEMERWVRDAGVAYRWDERLGGRRSVCADSDNVALRNPGFRGYADHMRSAEFTTALEELIEEAASRRTVILCAEAVWWRCHRRLVADAVELLRGIAVHHLLHDGRLQQHVPTEAARVAGDHLVYDRGAQGRLLAGD